MTSVAGWLGSVWGWATGQISPKDARLDVIVEAEVGDCPVDEDDKALLGAYLGAGRKQLMNTKNTVHEVERVISSLKSSRDNLHAAILEIQSASSSMERKLELAAMMEHHWANEYNDDDESSSGNEEGTAIDDGLSDLMEELAKERCMALRYKLDDLPKTLEGLRKKIEWHDNNISRLETKIAELKTMQSDVERNVVRVVESDICLLEDGINEVVNPQT